MFKWNIFIYKLFYYLDISNFKLI